MGYENRRCLFPLALVVLLSFILFPLKASAFSGSGSGSELAPYIITTADQLDEMRDDRISCYRLGADIDLDVSPYNAGPGWEPVGTEEHPFYGELDGAGYTISNLYINRPSQSCVGLFGFLGERSDMKVPFLVKDLVLVNVDIQGHDYVGGIAGSCQCGVIERCAVVGTLAGDDDDGGDGVGGLVGWIKDNTEMKECFSAGSVLCYAEAGGLVGESSYGTITDSFSRMDAVATSTQAGGIVAWAYDTVIERCYAAGSVSAPSESGGIIGAPRELVSAIDCHFDSTVTGQDDNDYGTPQSTSAMKEQSTFENWDFDSVWAIDSGRNDGYPFLQWAEYLFEEADDSSSGCNAGIPVPLFLLLLAPMGLLLRKSR